MPQYDMGNAPKQERIFSSLNAHLDNLCKNLQRIDAVAQSLIGGVVPQPQSIGGNAPQPPGPDAPALRERLSTVVEWADHVATRLEQL